MKKRSYRKSIIWVGIMAILLCLGVSAQGKAETLVESKIREIEVLENEFTIYLDQKQGEVFYPSASQSTLTLGNQTCQILSIQNLRDAKLGVVYDCIVDVSGSMDKDRIETAKELLRNLAEMKKENDVFRITRMGNERISSDYITDLAAINASIDEIELTHEDTNFYDSLKKEVEDLQNEENLPKRRCIVIFSDGAEDQKKGITKEEAEQAVVGSDIPVFTIAMMKSKPTETQITAAKTMGSFSRSSYGGMHFAPVVDGSQYEEAVSKIIAIGNDSLLVRVDLSGLELQRKAADLNMTLVSGDHKSNVFFTVEQDLAIEMLLSGKEKKEIAEEDGNLQDVASQDIIVQAGDTKEEVETAKTAENQEAVETEKPAQEKQKSNTKVILIIAIAACVILLIVLVVVLVFVTGSAKEKTKQVLTKVKLSLRRKADGQVIEKKMTSRITLGRGAGCDISLPQDAGLSETHCIFSLEQGCVYVKDNQSTNGIFVNGIPQTEKCVLHQEDVVLIGSAEYVITWN